jgi:hypothetical protein
MFERHVFLKNLTGFLRGLIGYVAGVDVNTCLARFRENLSGLVG